jgi:hypothetical protein
MKKPLLTKEQEEWVLAVIEEWYSAWIGEHLCFAKEILKKMLAPEECHQCKENYVKNFHVFLCEICLKKIINN